MIRLALIILIAIAAQYLHGQLNYLRLSPLQKIEQRIGMTDVSLAYSRPQMKGRKIFGSLVPYNKMWRTGANENTVISFSFKVKIGQQNIEAGSYALFTKPGKEEWDIYLYTETTNLDVPDPIDDSKLLYLTTVKSEIMYHRQETLTINFYDISETSASLGISWENTQVRLPIEFYTHEAMEQAMKKEFDQNVLDYAIAASYYSERDMNLKKAKQLQEYSIKLREKPSSWAYNSYGIILYKLGEREDAIDAIERSLQLAEENNNQYMIDENNRLLREWKK